MTILEDILAHKRAEVAQRKELYPTKLLERSPYYEAKPVSLTRYLRRPDKSGIIAEIKRRSPAKGDINRYASVEKLSIGYMQAGASALSVLTDSKYFGGSNEDLSLARKLNFCPILRKDFVVDEYQILEAKSIGADAVLLIAAALGRGEVESLARLARSLGLEVVLEVHSEEELSATATEAADIIGVNNRDLGTMKVDVETSLRLSARVPKGVVKISESGIDSAETITRLREAGYQGFLIGEAFMRTSKPEKACARLVEELRGRTC